MLTIQYVKCRIASSEDVIVTDLLTDAEEQFHIVVPQSFTQKRNVPKKFSLSIATHKK